MKIELMDKFYFPETERTYTDEGYLIVPATISRPGCQLYKAIELVPTEDSLPMEYRPSDPIVVYRPPEEVFRQESVDSFKNIAVTNNHPPEFLNSKNHKQYSVGIMLSDVHPEDDKYIKGTIKITDYETINDVKDGKVDVSAGYHSEIVFEKGITPEGEDYQAIQKNISGNHVAIVARGRAGSEVCLADGLDRPSEATESIVAEGIKRQSGTEASETRGENKRKKKSSEEEEEEYGIDGVPGDNMLSPFGDEKSTSNEDENKNKKKELEMQLADAMTKIDELEKANEKLASQVLDQASIDTLVEDRMQLIDACAKLVDGIDYTGKSNLDLKKEVLSSKMPDMDLNDKSADYVNAAFDVMRAGIKDTAEGVHDPEVYGEDLKLEDEEGVEEAQTPESEEKAIETTKNVHEGENPDEHGEDPVEEVPEEKLETKDSVSVLDSAFETEAKPRNNSKELSAYEKHCQRSRDAWKKK